MLTSVPPFGYNVLNLLSVIVGSIFPKISSDEDLYVALFDTGAYQDSLASHHCMLSSPAKILIQNGEMKIIRKRETPEEVGKQFGW